MVGIMGDKHHAKPTFCRSPYIPKYNARLAHTERRGWFVENQYPGSVVHRAGDGDGLAFTTRQRADRLIDITYIDAHLGHLVFCCLAHLGGLHEHTVLHRFGTEEKVSPHRHERSHGQVLVHGGNTAKTRVAWRLERDRLAVDQVLT